MCALLYGLFILLSFHQCNSESKLYHPLFALTGLPQHNGIKSSANMIQLWYHVLFGYIKPYFIRTDSSLWRKVLNATAANTISSRWRDSVWRPQKSLSITPVHQTEPFPLVDILLSHRDSKGELMHKCKEQCAAIQIQQEKQGPKQEDQNINIWPLTETLHSFAKPFNKGKYPCNFIYENELRNNRKSWHNTLLRICKNWLDWGW